MFHYILYYNCFHSDSQMKEHRILDPNFSQEGSTPVQFAARGGLTNTVKFLMEIGDDMDAKDGVCVIILLTTISFRSILK
jgi:hypothetical protein